MTSKKPGDQAEKLAWRLRNRDSAKSAGRITIKQNRAHGEQGRRGEL